MREMVRTTIANLDHLLSGVSLTTLLDPSHNAHGAGVRQAVEATTLPVDAVLLICLTLVLMTLVLRFLEFCLFKIKI